MPESRLHRYELMEERRTGDARRSDDRAAHERRSHDRRRGRSLVDAPAVRRVFPITEGDERAGLRTRERRQQAILMAGDAVAVAVAVVLAYADVGRSVDAAAVAGAMALAVVIAALFGHYQRDQLVLRRSTLDEVPQLLQIAAVVTLAAWSVALTGLHQGGVITLWLGLAAALVGGRFCARVLARSVLPPERCLFVGDMSVAEHVRGKVGSGRANAVVVAALPLRAGEGAEAFKGVDGLRGLIERQRIDRVVIAPVSTDMADTIELIRIAKLACAKVSIFPRLFEVIGTAVEFEDLEGLTLIGVRRFGLSGSARAAKRAFDLLVATTTVIAVAPLMALIALAIRLDSPGPVLFRQIRVGRDGRRFSIFKFRTMVADAEGHKDALRARNETTGLFKLSDDPRITRVGRLLRRTSLDELPQLINVLRGEMSLVGPRPLVIDEDDQILGLDRARLHLTPGMTGPWQIMRSGRVPMDEMVTIDYQYVANWSLWVDLKLLVRTVGYVVARGGV